MPEIVVPFVTRPPLAWTYGVVLFAALSLAGCDETAKPATDGTVARDGGDTGTVDASRDVGRDHADGTETAIDSGTDTRMDSAPDEGVDAGPDERVDLRPDVGMDSGTDSGTDASTCLPSQQWTIGQQAPLQLTSKASDFMLAFELPPYLVPQPSGKGVLLSLSTIWQANCLTTINPLTDAFEVSVTTAPPCAIANYAYDFGSIAGFEQKKPSDLRNPNDPWYKAAWRRSWYANLSQHVSPSGWIFGVAHGENKGQVWLDPNDDYKVKQVGSEVYGFNTTLFPVKNDPTERAYNPSSRQPECALAHGGNTASQDCPKTYSAFVSLVRMGTWANIGSGVASPGYLDYGPVAWPVDGYVQNGAGTGRNTVHAFGVTWKGFLYIYYVDWSSIHLDPSKSEFNGGLGVKVVRASLAELDAVFNDDALRPSALFESYCRGLSCCPARDPDGNGWGRAMPAGFSADDGSVYNFLDKRGCAKTLVDTGNLSTLSAQFSVARSTEGGLLAAHWTADVSSGKNTVELMTSDDGIRWNLAAPILEAANLAQLTMKHPNLLDHEGKSSELINPTNFYILGTQHTPTVKVNAIQVRRNCTP